MLSIGSFCNNGLSLGSSLQQSYVQNNKMQFLDATKLRTHFWLPSLQKKLKVSAAFKAVTAGSQQPKKDLYGILGVAPDASRQEIKASYRRLAKQLHPDSVASSSSSVSAVDFMAVQAAYSVLSDPESRAKYDRSVAFLFLRKTGTTAHVGSRNWETDQCF